VFPFRIPAQRYTFVYHWRHRQAWVSSMTLEVKVLPDGGRQ
jgi:hypothetical protein